MTLRESTSNEVRRARVRNQILRRREKRTAYALPLPEFGGKYTREGNGNSVRMYTARARGVNAKWRGKGCADD